MECGTRIQGFGRNRVSFEKLGSGKTKKIKTKRLKKSILGKNQIRNRDVFLGAGAGAGGRGPGPGAGGRELPISGPYMHSPAL